MIKEENNSINVGWKNLNKVEYYHIKDLQCLFLPKEIRQTTTDNTRVFAKS